MEDRDFKFYYNEIHPPAGISHLAGCFFDFTVKSTTTAPIPHEVYPDGCISLLYRRNPRLGITLLLIKGLSLKTFHTEVLADDVHWGVKFSPAACIRVLRQRPEEVQTRPVEDEEILPHLVTGLLEKLNDCRNFKEAAAVYARLLKGLGISSEEIDPKIAEAVGIIEKTKGEMKIAEIAAKVGLSTRQLERRFRECSGLTPKQFLRVRRLYATSINVIEEKHLNWADRAAEMGFTDQSHLNREFSTLTGRTPKSFAEFLENIEYDELVR
ncbi:MAG: AraC family transcriptional regulator [Pyrinomonadaceae bacterium]